MHFIEVRANLFRTIYFHRTVRALDVALEEVFEETVQRLFPGNPLEHLEAYRQFTEASFLVDVERWPRTGDADQKRLGAQWQAILTRNVHWAMAAERIQFFHMGASEQASIFSEPEIISRRLKRRLPAALRSIPLRVDVARHYHRPSTRLPAGGQNFVYDPADGEPRELTDYELFRTLPLSFSICRVYAHDHAHDHEIRQALNHVLGDAGDSKTNM